MSGIFFLAKINAAKLHLRTLTNTNTNKSHILQMCKKTSCAHQFLIYNPYNRNEGDYMSSIPEKKLSPPFVSHKSYTNFINTLRDYESLPDVIDKSLMPKSSGSQITAIMSALKYLGHPIDETGKLTDSFQKIYLCIGGRKKTMIMAQLLRKNYDFHFFRH